MRLEDEIIDRLTSGKPEYGRHGSCTQSFFGEIEGKWVEAIAIYDYHDSDDYQSFDGRSCLVQSTQELDSLTGLHAVCWDIKTDEDYNLDLDYMEAQL